MNIFSSNFTSIISILAIVLGAYCFWQIITFNKLKKTFFAGNQALDLETVILKLDRDLKSGRQRQNMLESELAELSNKLSFAVQKVALVRFNPFNEDGGNFSFAIALLDDQNNGLVITSMHGRQQNRVYSKKITNGKSDSKLTDEEMEAITEAHSK